MRECGWFQYANGILIGRPDGYKDTKDFMLSDALAICHTRTVDMPSVCREAEILIVAAGRAGVVTKDYFAPGQTVIDVGINVDENGNLCGDVDYEQAEPVVDAVTPVPGGVGTVTASILVGNVIMAAKRAADKGRSIS